MKHLFIVFIILLTNLVALCQAPLVGVQREQVINDIESAAVATNSMQRSFVQTRTSSLLTDQIVMKGRFCYTKPSDVIWEYVSPQQRIIKVTGKDVTITTEGNTTPVNPRIKKMVQGFSGMLMGNKAQMLDGRVFKIDIYEEKNTYRAVLKPKRRDLQKLFSQMELEFGKETKQVEAITLIERQGDEVKIEFEEMK